MAAHSNVGALAAGNCDIETLNIDEWEPAGKLSQGYLPGKDAVRGHCGGVVHHHFTTRTELG
jgi:hypothetical protein